MYRSTTIDTDQQQHVHVDGHATCPCGQELDACRRAHCPRCGHRLELREPQLV